MTGACLTRTYRDDPTWECRPYTRDGRPFTQLCVEQFGVDSWRATASCGIPLDLGIDIAIGMLASEAAAITAMWTEP